MSFADAALRAAGHEVSAPALRDLREEVIRGEITTEQALSAGVAHIDAK